ncbi:MAG: hypothetical protein FWE80_10340, partial [Oscillospiraceae bacterium]|nr:hypothetical protein [Oscillospiraceae bacterium]
GEDGPWQNTGVWQNTVKITPRDSIEIDNWPGDWDDDWVLTDITCEIRLNLIKMTTKANYPMPLDGCEFKLYKSDSVYTDGFPASITLGGGAWPQVGGTLKPYDFIGLDEADRPVITTGSYVLKETYAPAHYKSNENREWYLIYSNGRLRMFADKALQAELPLGEEQGTLPSYPNTLIYGAHIENDEDPGTPKATIRLVKWNRDRTEKLPGETIDTGNGHLLFTGAVFAMKKFDNDSWEGNSYNYGSMLAYGYDRLSTDPNKEWLQGETEIEPGYYELVEIRAPQEYMTDPTPIYIRFDPDANPQLYIKADNHHVESGHLDAEIDINGPRDATVNAKNTKPVYKLTIQKYNKDTEAAIDGIDFKLINTADGALVNTYTTAEPDGKAVITIPGAADGVYLLRESLNGQPYAQIPEYTIEVRNGELYVRGGPHAYDFKIVRGQRDDRYYVILQPDGAAIPVYDGPYPEDLLINHDDALQIGLIHATIGVPNQELPSAKAVIRGEKTVTGTGTVPAKTFEFTLTQLKSKALTDEKNNGIVRKTTVNTNGTGSYTFDFGDLYFTEADTYYFKVEETTPGGYWKDKTGPQVIKIVVEDGEATVYYPDGSGGFVAGPGGGLTFVNDYETSAEVIIRGKKTITGSGWKAQEDAFSFTLTQVKNEAGEEWPAPPPAITETVAVAIEAGVTDYAFSFSFSLPGDGTYWFEITEDTPDLGWISGGERYIVKVVVKDGLVAVYYPDGTVEGDVLALGDEQRITIEPGVIVDGDKDEYTAAGTQEIDLHIHAANYPDRIVSGAAYCLRFTTGLGDRLNKPLFSYEDFAVEFPDCYQEVLWLLRNGFMSSGKSDMVTWAGENNLAALQILTGVGGTLTE